MSNRSVTFLSDVWQHTLGISPVVFAVRFGTSVWVRPCQYQPTVHSLLLLLSPTPASNMQMVSNKHPLASVALLLNLRESATTGSPSGPFTVCRAAALSASKLRSSLYCSILVNGLWIWVMPGANYSTQHLSPSGLWITEPCFSLCCHNSANELNYLILEPQQLYVLWRCSNTIGALFIIQLHTCCPELQKPKNIKTSSTIHTLQSILIYALHVLLDQQCSCCYRLI